MPEKKEINIEVGSRIKYQRERAGLTQAKFAEMIGMETKTISSVERGVVGISLSTMQTICKTLSISSDVLLFDITPENNVDNLSNRLKRLTPKEFDIVEGVIMKVLEAFIH